MKLWACHQGHRAVAAELTALPKFTNGGTSANPEAISACLELPSQQAVEVLP